MSNLTETFCFKMEPKMKDFLGTIRNPSDYVRQLILQNMSIRESVKSISSIENVDGKDYYAYDEDELRKLIANQVMDTMMFHIFNETQIILKKN